MFYAYFVNNVKRSALHARLRQLPEILVLMGTDRVTLDRRCSSLPLVTALELCSA